MTIYGIELISAASISSISPFFAILEASVAKSAVGVVFILARISRSPGLEDRKSFQSSSGIKVAATGILSLDPVLFRSLWESIPVTAAAIRNGSNP